MYCIRERTHYYNYGDVTLRWRTSAELCLVIDISSYIYGLVKPSSGRSSVGSYNDSIALTQLWGGIYTYSVKP